MKQTPLQNNGSVRVPRGDETASPDWLPRVRRVASPNCDARPDPDDISLLVIHGISLPPGRFGGPWVEALFTNTLDPGADPAFASIATLRVSAHLFVRRDGRTVQFVPLRQRAWHAGVSIFEGRERCNDYSIGIELEGTDERAYTERQYRRLAVLCRQLIQRFPAITPNRVVGHSDIAPGRKTDPGPAFDWIRLRRALQAGVK